MYCEQEKERDLFFYLLPDEIAHFEVIPKLIECVQTDQVVDNLCPQSVTQALKYKYPVNYLGKDAQNIKVVCIAARDLQIHSCNKDQPSLPFLIKTDKQTQSKGYRSGHRSAIKVINNKFYRYKGCGNDGVGFVIENNQLRGSHFWHTAKRELFMTKYINSILFKEIGVESANIPLFLYRFPSNIQSYGLKNQIQLLNKYCCVFETIGDRRVGTHLISPLEILFLNLFEVKDLDLTSFFKQKERKDQYGLTELLVDFELMIQKGKTFLQILDKSKEFTNYVNLRELRKIGEVNQTKNIEEIVTKLAHKFSEKNHERIIDSFKGFSNWMPAIEALLEKIGWQMGQIKRIFCENGINWGFFNDQGEWHCNAHLNNFVFSHADENSRFTKPLDFDLAFNKEQYINIQLDAETYGQRDDDYFEQMLLSEYNSMEMSVSGVQIMNFKYSIEEEEKEPSLQMKMARIIFRDTLVRAFRWGMRNNQTECNRINQNWNKNIIGIGKLVESCLLLSANFQT